MKTSKFYLICIALVSIFISCENDEMISDEFDTSLSDYVNLETSIEEVESVVDEYALYAKGLDFEALSDKGGNRIFDRAKFFSTCVNFEKEQTESLKTITITFLEDCVDKRGNEVSGMIVITKEMLESSKSRSITFTDFSVNGYVVNGTREYEHIDSNEEGNPEMSCAVNLTIETEEGTITKIGSRLVEVTAGGDTDSYEDNELTITGSHTLTKADGTIVEMEIAIPLVKPAGCKYAASGVKEITKNEELSTVDYGDGTCDDVALLTNPDGSTEEIEIKKKRKHKRH